MKKTSTLFTLALLLVTAAMILPQAASAYRGNPNIKGPNFSPERHEAMEKAFESNDYNAWKKLMDGKGRVTQVITEENFSKLAKAHELAEDGKFEEAKKIRQELGLGNGDGSRGCRNGS